MPSLGEQQLQLTFVFSVNRKGSIKYTRRGGAVDNKGKQNVRLNFDLQADLSSLFNWNTKQVFVYLTAEYDGVSTSSRTIKNKVTFWDRIITTRDAAQLSLKNQHSSYSVYDIQKSFKYVFIFIFFLC